MLDRPAKVLNARYGGTWPHYDSVCVDRSSKWGNPYHLGEDGNRDEVIEKYEQWIRARPELLARLGELKGKDLVCWCAPKRCHADVLLKLLEERMPDGTTVVTPPAAPQMTVAQMTELYIKLRDKRDEVKKAHTEQLQPYNDMMGKLEGLLHAELQRAQLDSMRSEAGTVYRSTETSVSVKDWPATLAFIQDNKLFDLFEARVSKTAAIAVIEETKAPIPGVQITQTEVLRVRRS